MGAWNEDMLGNDYALDKIDEFLDSSNKYTFYSNYVYSIAGQYKQMFKNKPIHEILRVKSLYNSFHYDSIPSLAILGLTQYILTAKKKNKKLISFIKSKEEFLHNVILLEGHNSSLNEWSDSNKRLKELLNFKRSLTKEIKTLEDQ